MTLSITGKSVVTSGIYERHLEINGKDYHHIFDSETGYPIETDLASLTIISDRSVDGEIWTHDYLANVARLLCGKSKILMVSKPSSLTKMDMSLVHLVSNGN